MEDEPGIWVDTIEERPYKGDITRSGRRFDNSENINDNFTITNVFSIISDAFLYSHIPAMRYIEYLGSKFKIVSVFCVVGDFKQETFCCTFFAFIKI